MAEHYGVVPKKFTKAWWGYFWYYYKWHTIGIAALIAAVVFTIIQVNTRPEYDLTVTYAGHQVFSDEQTAALCADWGGMIADTDGNGESAVELTQLNYADMIGNEQYDTAMDSKLDLSLYDETSFIYIADEKRLMRMMNTSYRADVYSETTDWAADVDDDRLYLVEGKPYAVSLRDSAYFNERGYKTEDMYMVLRKNYEEKDSAVIGAYAESLKLAEYLVK